MKFSHCTHCGKEKIWHCFYCGCIFRFGPDWCACSTGVVAQCPKCIENEREDKKMKFRCAKCNRFHEEYYCESCAKGMIRCGACDVLHRIGECCPHCEWECSCGSFNKKGVACYQCSPTLTWRCKCGECGSSYPMGDFCRQCALKRCVHCGKFHEEGHTCTKLIKTTYMECPTCRYRWAECFPEKLCPECNKDPLRGTGRTTGLMLKAIAEACLNPGKEVEFKDHEKMLVYPASKKAQRIADICGELGLNVSVKHPYDKVCLVSHGPKGDR